MLVKQGYPKPLPADPKSLQSTSSNVHAYVGDFLSHDQHFTSLLLDSEGSYGTIPWTSR